LCRWILKSNENALLRIYAYIIEIIKLHIEEAFLGNLMHLCEELAAKVAEWRQKKYLCAEYPALAEILDWVNKKVGDKISLMLPTN